MEKHYFEFDYSCEFEEFSIQTFGWADSLENSEADDDSAFESRATFESDYYLEYCIISAIGNPPSGSGFKLERTESDYSDYGSSVYERLIYFYKSNKITHSCYLKKLYKILNSKRWADKCLKSFETEYQKFIEFKKKHPEEDYEF